MLVVWPARSDFGVQFDTSTKLSASKLTVRTVVELVETQIVALAHGRSLRKACTVAELVEVELAEVSLGCLYFLPKSYRDKFKLRFSTTNNKQQTTNNNLER
ncbi:MAG TPA: hypothetical protein DCP31_05775 [Cyanobacteria bacterium UBA8543]|nr:hypothetical protein [Cyanobacteria bacterium UBA8543]